MFADCFLPSSANCPANAQTQPSTLSLHSAVSTVDEEPMNIIQGDLVHATPPPAHARTHTHTHTHTKRHICTYIRAHIQAYAHTCECVRGGASKRETLSARERAWERAWEKERARERERERQRDRGGMYVKMCVFVRARVHVYMYAQNINICTYHYICTHKYRA